MKITQVLSQGVYTLYTKATQTKLKWAFPFALLAAACFLTYRRLCSSRVEYKPPVPPKPIEPQPSSLTRLFCENHGIKFQSPLLDEINEIEELLKNPEAGIHAVRYKASKLPQSDELGQIINDLKNTKIAVLQIFERLKTLLASLKAPELEKQKAFLPAIEAALKKSPSNEHVSLGTYLSIMLPPNRLGYYVDILPKRGISSMNDMNLLFNGLWTDRDLDPILKFHYLLEALPDDQSIKDVLEKYLKALSQKIESECKIALFEGKRDYLESVATALSMFDVKDCSAQISNHCRSLFRDLKLPLVLDAYINQYKGHQCWLNLKEANPQMTLVDLAKLHPDLNFFQLDAFFEAMDHNQ